MSDDVYCYPPDFTILKNKAGLRNADRLDQFERRMVTARIVEGVSTGDFDLMHLRAIHRHLFQDVYEWAGDIRTVEINKGSSQFQFCRYIETGINDVHRRIQAHGYLKNLDADDFSDLAGEIIGDVNYAHPFREGNGRTQLQYFKQLAQKAGHAVDLTRIEQSAWMNASRKAHLGDYAPMGACIRGALSERKRNQSQSRSRRR